MSKLINILSIDGGGIRGIIPAVILAEIEKRTNRPIASLFDLVAGTSTGGILALGLTIPKNPAAKPYSAEQMAGMYELEGQRIFSRSPLRTVFSCDNLTLKKYPATGIEEVLLEYFGDSRLRDSATDLLIPSYELERRLPFFFRSSRARRYPDYDFAARDVARAASAAPSYFEPLRLLTPGPDQHYTLIDGGVFANNPAACALVEARTAHPDAPGYLVLSLGTGSLARTLPLGLAKYWGTVRWVKPLLDVIFDGVSSTVDYQLHELLSAGHYYRFQTGINGDTQSLDNTSRSNTAALKALGREVVQKESKRIDELCAALLESTTSQLQTA